MRLSSTGDSRLALGSGAKHFAAASSLALRRTCISYRTTKGPAAEVRPRVGHACFQGAWLTLSRKQRSVPRRAQHRKEADTKEIASLELTPGPCHQSRRRGGRALRTDEGYWLAPLLLCLSLLRCSLTGSTLRQPWPEARSRLGFGRAQWP